MADVFDLAALQAANSRFRPSRSPSLGPIPRPARRMRALTRAGPREISRPPSRISPAGVACAFAQA